MQAVKSQYRATCAVSKARIATPEQDENEREVATFAHIGLIAAAIVAEVEGKR